MEHITPIIHPTQEMDAVTQAKMRKPSVVSVEKPTVMEREWGFAARVDPTVSVEEYMYWAKIEREMELDENKKFHEENGSSPLRNMLRSSLTKQGRQEAKMEKQGRITALQSNVDGTAPPPYEKNTSTGVVAQDAPNQPTESELKVTDAEWRTAARALRTASWGQMFFLITTDILGWSGAPFVFASVGYGAGVALYIIFGIFAGFSG